MTILNTIVMPLMLVLLGDERLSGADALLLSEYSSQSLMRSVSGIVIDKGGHPLNGCSVVIKGTSSSTVTDVCGEFILPVEQDEFTIVFQSSSYEDQRTFELRLDASELKGERIVFQIGRSKVKNKAWCRKESGNRLKKFVIE